jgi:hypothetical protein
MDQKKRPPELSRETSTVRKRYQKPVLVVHGTVAELTLSGGRKKRDAFKDKAPS